MTRTDDVLDRARRVFGDADRANRWMKRPHPELDGECPLDLLRSGSGAEAVLDLLGRIEHGVYS